MEFLKSVLRPFIQGLIFNRFKTALSGAVLGMAVTMLATSSLTLASEKRLSEKLPSAQWHSQQYYSADMITVKFAGLKTEPRFIVTLPDGSSFLLKSQYSSPSMNFSGPTSAAQDASEAESTRAILQSFARVISAEQSFHYAFTKTDSGKIFGLKLDHEKLKQGGVYEFDPIRAMFHTPSAYASNTSEQGVGERYSNTLTGQISKIHFDIPSELIAKGFQKPEPIDVKNTSVKDRIKSVMQFLLDRVVFSTKFAFNRNIEGRQKIKNNWDEIGLQFGFKLEMIGGLGQHNLSAVRGVFFYIGFNRRTFSFVFRRGLRQEKLGDGVGASLSGKFEPKVYRINSEEADKADPRKGYASIVGESWYPPGLPAGSAVFDTGRGFQSDGIAIGPNLADFGGGFALNTVTNFQETQRVFTFGLPDPSKWLESIRSQFDPSSRLFPVAYHIQSFGLSVSGQCEVAFRSTVDVGF